MMLTQLIDESHPRHRDLLRRTDATIASSVICAALKGRYVSVDSNHAQVTKRMSAHVMSQLTGISHGSIQTTLGILDSLDVVLS